MKILNVCETAAGGIATYFSLLSEMSSSQYDHVFLSPEYQVSSMARLSSVRTFAATRRGVGALFSMAVATLRAIREERPDVIFFHSTFSLFALVVVRLFANSQFKIYCAHGWAVNRYPEGSLRARVVGLIEGKLCGLADRVIDISPADWRVAKQLGYSGRHVVIENAAGDPMPDARDDLFPDQDDLLHLLYVGRFDRQKGLDILLRAFEMARKTSPNLRLHIVGASILADGEAVHVPDGAYVYGWVNRDEIDSWFRSADALVVPSRWEGFGLVVPEAYRNGTPVIGSRVGAIPDMVSPFDTGLLFDLDVAELTRCLESLNKADLKRMSSKCKEVFQSRFSKTRFLMEFEVFLAQLGEKGSVPDSVPAY